MATRNAQIARQGSDVLGTALAAAGNGYSDFTLGQLGAAESRSMMRLVEPAKVSNKRSILSSAAMAEHTKVVRDGIDVFFQLDLRCCGIAMAACSFAERHCVSWTL